MLDCFCSLFHFHWINFLYYLICNIECFNPLSTTVPSPLVSFFIELFLKDASRDVVGKNWSFWSAIRRFCTATLYAACCIVFIMTLLYAEIKTVAWHYFNLVLIFSTQDSVSIESTGTTWQKLVVMTFTSEKLMVVMFTCKIHGQKLASVGFLTKTGIIFFLEVRSSDFYGQKMTVVTFTS